jgi:hypothetical protein
MLFELIIEVHTASSVFKPVKDQVHSSWNWNCERTYRYCRCGFFQRKATSVYTFPCFEATQFRCTRVPPYSMQKLINAWLLEQRQPKTSGHDMFVIIAAQRWLAGTPEPRTELPRIVLALSSLCAILGGISMVRGYLCRMILAY